jgi:hypothetical protein
MITLASGYYNLSLTPISWVIGRKKCLYGGFASHGYRERQVTCTDQAAEFAGNTSEAWRATLATWGSGIFRLE